MPDGVLPLMADQVVKDEPLPTSNPDASSGDHAAGNGRLLTPRDVGAVRLRAEFEERVAAARAIFRSTLDVLRLAVEDMDHQGRPPSYQLVHALGECRREFHRLRNDLSRRAAGTSLTLPPIETLDGLAALTRLFDPVAESEPFDPVGPGSESRSREPVPPPAPDRPKPPSGAARGPWRRSSKYRHPTRSSFLRPRSNTPARPSGGRPWTPSTRSWHLASGTAASSPRSETARRELSRMREAVAGSPPSELPGEAADLAEGRHAFSGLLTIVSGVEHLFVTPSRRRSTPGSARPSAGRLAVAAGTSPGLSAGLRPPDRSRVFVSESKESSEQRVPIERVPTHAEQANSGADGRRLVAVRSRRVHVVSTRLGRLLVLLAAGRRDVLSCRVVSYARACVRQIDAHFLGGSRTLRFSKAAGFGFAAAVGGGVLIYLARTMIGVGSGLITILAGYMVGSAVRQGTGYRGGRVYQLLAVFLTYSRSRGATCRRSPRRSLTGSTRTPPPTTRSDPRSTSRPPRRRRSNRTPTA